MRKREPVSAAKVNTRMANLPNGAKPAGTMKAQARAIVLSSEVRADGAHGEGGRRNLRGPLVLRLYLRLAGERIT